MSMGVLNAKEEQAALSFLSGRCRTWAFRLRRNRKYARRRGESFDAVEMAEHSAVRRLEDAIAAVLSTGERESALEAEGAQAGVETPRRPYRLNGALVGGLEALTGADRQRGAEAEAEAS